MAGRATGGHAACSSCSSSKAPQVARSRGYPADGRKQPLPPIMFAARLRGAAQGMCSAEVEKDLKGTYRFNSLAVVRERLLPAALRPMLREDNVKVTLTRKGISPPRP